MTKFPKYFQMGTVVDNPQDFYGGRLPNSQRKGTLTEQLLADEQVTQVGGERERRAGLLRAWALDGKGSAARGTWRVTA